LWIQRQDSLAPFDGIIELLEFQAALGSPVDRLHISPVELAREHDVVERGPIVSHVEVGTGAVVVQDGAQLSIVLDLLLQTFGVRDDSFFVLLVLEVFVAFIFICHGLV
jgi:hypothetical protein